MHVKFLFYPTGFGQVFGSLSTWPQTTYRKGLRDPAGNIHNPVNMREGPMKYPGIGRGVCVTPAGPLFEFTRQEWSRIFFRLCWVCKCTVELNTLVGSMDEGPEGITVFRTEQSGRSIHISLLFLDV